MMALEVCFCACPVAWRSKAYRSIILSSRIVEMGPYCSCVSVTLKSHNFTARASWTWTMINMTWRTVLWTVVAPQCNELWSSELCWMKVVRQLIPVMCICGGDSPIGFGATELWKLTRFGKCENRLQFRSSYLLVRLCYCKRTCNNMKHFQCTLWWLLLVTSHTDFE